jgi:hypothetical protein
MEKYDATPLPTLMEQSNKYIAEFKKLETSEEIAAYRKDVLPPIEEVEEKISNLSEFIDYRQSLADKAKDEGNDDEFEKLLNLKLVGLMNLRKCKKTLTSLLKLYKDVEKKSDESGSKLLKMLKASAAAPAPAPAPAPVAAPVAASDSDITPEEMDDFHEFVNESKKIEMAVIVDEMFELQKEFNNKMSELQKRLMMLQLGL